MGSTFSTILFVLVFLAITVFSIFYTRKKAIRIRKKNRKFSKSWKILVIHITIIVFLDLITVWALPLFLLPILHLLSCLLVPTYLLIYHPFA